MNLEQELENKDPFLMKQHEKKLFTILKKFFVRF